MTGTRLDSHVTDDTQPGRPAPESVFAAFVVTTVPAVVLVQLLARILPPPPGASPPAAALTVVVSCVSLAFAIAQALLPGPQSSGCVGLAIPMAGAVTLAFQGQEPAVVVSALFAGVFLTPTAYYLAIRFSFALRSFVRRRPITALLAAAFGSVLLLQALLLVTHLADRSIDWRLFR